MTDVNTTYTSLTDAINICLSCIGETPVDAPNNTSTNVVLSKQIIEEVSRDVQSKGWWFNTSGANISLYANSGSGASEDFNSSIPEEARRYISIRAARVLQSRFVGSEELQKFSFQEEQVSLAILTQAHVRNGGNATSFNSFPSELKQLGIEEVMFLQQSAEEKLLSLRLKTELKTVDKVVAETGVANAQSALIYTQLNTEIQETYKRAAEKGLVDAQKSQVQTETVLRSQQALTELEETNLVAQNAIKTAAEAGLVTSQQALVAQQVLDVVADVTLKTKQGEKIDEEVALLQTQDLLTSAQKDTELQNAIKVAAEAGLVTAQQALVAQQVLDSVADVILKGKQGLLLDEQIATEQKETDKRESEKELVDEQKALVTKQALTETQNAIKIAAESGLVTSQQALVSQQVLESVANVSNITADVTLKGKQGSLIDAQASTETQNAIKVAADAGLVTAQQALVAQQVLESVANVSNITADVTLKDKQGIKTDAEAGLVTQQQALTAQQTLDVSADTTLKGKQGSLVDAQELKTDAEKLQVDAQTSLLESQKTQLDAQTAIEATAEKAFYDGVVAGTQDTYRDYAAEMRMMGIQESTFQQTPAYKKVELLKDAVKLRTSTATETNQNSDEIEQVNKVLRFIGEPPIITLGDNALASETARLLRDTDAELQGRGWWFNTYKNEEFEPDGGIIPLEDVVLSIEVDGIPTHMSRYGAGYRLFNRDANSATAWNSTIKATVIYKKGLNNVPKKYLEYLNVRTAILLTEMYPQSGIDIQRLPKMEQELRAYFKDRQNDEANYSIFDNYDAAARIGINRNYSLI